MTLGSQLSDRVGCSWHPEQLTSVHCLRCGRPICGQCQSSGPCCPACAGEDGAIPGSRPASPVRAVAAQFRVTKVVMVLVALNTASLIVTSVRPALEVDGAQIPAEIARGQAYRLFTAMFVHVDVSHLVLNMAALLIMGPLVEEALGSLRFLALYLLAGVGGFVVSFLFGPLLGASVGSSGAIFGVCGGWFSLVRTRRRGDTAAVALLIALLLGYSFYDTSIDWRAHVGGLATGILVGLACAWTARRPPRLRAAWEAVVAVGALAVVAAAVVVRSVQLR